MQKIKDTEWKTSKKQFNTLNSNAVVWKISYYKNNPSVLIIFPVLWKMNNISEVEYTVANNSIHATEPKNATSSSAGYDLFAAEEKILLPRFVKPITIELKMEILCSHFGKIYPRLSLLKNYFASCDAGAIDSDFWGSVLILMTCNSKDPVLIKASQRVAHIVFHKKEEVVLKKSDCLNSTERGTGGFGSTGI